jgi:hypothetical protein
MATAKRTRTEGEPSAASSAKRPRTDATEPLSTDATEPLSTLLTIHVNAQLEGFDWPGFKERIADRLGQFWRYSVNLSDIKFRVEYDPENTEHRILPLDPKNPEDGKIPSIRVKLNEQGHLERLASNSTTTTTDIVDESEDLNIARDYVSLAIRESLKPQRVAKKRHRVHRSEGDVELHRHPAARSAVCPSTAAPRPRGG